MEIIVTFCDKCNIDCNLNNPKRLPPDVVKAMGMGDQADGNGDVWVNQGVRIGPADQAQADGWEERDYGLICPLCVLEELSSRVPEEDDSGLSLTAELADQATEQASKPEVAEKKPRSRVKK